MVSIHRSKIGSPAYFSKWRKARKYSSIIGHSKYDGLKGPCQKICCSKTVKMKKAEVYSSIKLHRIRGLKGVCQNKIKRNHVYDFNSFYFDTFSLILYTLPLILVFYAAYYWRIYLCFLLFNSSVQQIFDIVPFYHQHIWLGIIAMDRYRSYWSILLVIQATDCIDPSVKIFSFLTDSINHWFEEKKLFFRQNRTIGSRFFLLLKTIDLIDVFYS
jgi:hypothetical protein